MADTFNALMLSDDDGTVSHEIKQLAGGVRSRPVVDLGA